MKNCKREKGWNRVADNTLMISRNFIYIHTKIGKKNIPKKIVKEHK